MRKFNTFAQDLFDEAFDLSDVKGQDYRVGSKKVHRNFVSVGERLGVEPLTVLSIYMAKHFDAIKNYIKTEGASESEPIRERILDAVNYITLGAALVDSDATMEQSEYEQFRLDFAKVSLRYSFSITGKNRILIKLDKFLKLISESPTAAFTVAAPQVITTLIAFLYIDE